MGQRSNVKETENVKETISGQKPHSLSVVRDQNRPQRSNVKQSNLGSRSCTGRACLVGAYAVSVPKITWHTRRSIRYVSTASRIAAQAWQHTAHRIAKIRNVSTAYRIPNAEQHTRHQYCVSHSQCVAA
eukprot:2581832-Rhodomonas_salina.1